MGILISRFRKKGSALEVLEKLENEIKEIEESKSYAQTRQRKIAKILYLYSLGMCFICGIIIYLQYSSTLKEKLLYLVPLALSPIVLLIINKIISWYYVKLINKSQSRLIEMKKEKKRILDEVMDKETYKVAKEILEKYSTEVPTPNELRRRTVVSTLTSPQGKTPPQQVRKPPPYPPQLSQPVGIRSPMTSKVSAVQGPPAPALRLPAPILPLQRSYLDRMVEYLIGDGPNNRFALICSRCHSHNGMALKEEFEYINFKCCYCFFYNPARKVRPEAPKLEESSFSQNENHSSDSDSDAKTSTEEDDKKVTVEAENSNEPVEKTRETESIKTESTNNQDNDEKPGAEIEEEPVSEPLEGEKKNLINPPSEETTANTT